MYIVDTKCMINEMESNLQTRDVYFTILTCCCVKRDRIGQPCKCGKGERLYHYLILFRVDMNSEDMDNFIFAIANKKSSMKLSKVFMKLLLILFYLY